jgi:hypothetical protein
MVGTAPLVTGATIEIGQTALVIGQLIPNQVAKNGSNAPLPPPVPAQVQVTAIAPATPKPPVPGPEANYPSDEFNPVGHTPRSNQVLSALQPTPANPAPEDRQRGSETTLRPGTAPVFQAKEDRSSVVPKAPATPSEPVAPRRPERARDTIKPVTIAPIAVEPEVAAAPVVDLEATVSTLPIQSLPAPAKPTPPPFVQPRIPTPLPNAPQIAPGAIPATALAANAVATGAGNVANSDDRSYFITVLGRRIGPLSRAIARDLKARELKGTLRPADLEPYPQA